MIQEGKVWLKKITNLKFQPLTEFEQNFTPTLAGGLFSDQILWNKSLEKCYR